MWPPEIKTLPPILGDPLQAIVERINLVTPIDGKGTRVAQGISGRSINVRGSAGSNATTAGDSFSLAIYDASTKARPSYIGVTIGTINGLIPKGMIAGDDPPAEFKVAGKQYIYAGATFQEKKFQWIQSYIYISSQNDLVNRSTRTDAYTLIGTVDTGGSSGMTITQEIYGPVIIPPSRLNWAS